MRIDIVRDERGWRDALLSCGPHDFAHTWTFHDISRRRGEGDPEMYIALDDEDRTLAAWPLLRRPINDDRYDLTSVYGHVGPLTADGADAGACFDAILDTMRSEGAVSLFSRMHPVLDQRLPETWRGEPAGRVVIIDASDPASVVQSYRTDHRQGIARARGRGLTVRQRSGSDAVTLFHQIYSEAMVDLDAKEFYFFDSDYFHGLTAAQDFDVTILFAEFEGQTVSASTILAERDQPTGPSQPRRF
jgi:hypothetical protein